MANVSAKVVATMTVEVDVGTWGGEANFDQLHEQVKREAETKLSNILRKAGGEARILSSPIVKVVTFERS